MAATIKVPTVFTAKDQFTKVVSKMTRGVKKFSRDSMAAVKRFDNRLNKTFNKLGDLSKLALGLGIGGLFAMAIQNNIAYEDSLASVSAITGATGKELAKLEKMSMQTAKSQKMLGSEVLKAYELIGSAQPELLKNTELLDEVTNAAVTLSKAGRMELEPAAQALTTTLNQFNLGGEHAKTVIDNLAAGSVAGASTITQTAEAIKKFGTNAAAAGIKVNESIALIQLASPFEKGAEAGTKLRNILQKMSGARVLPPEQLKMLQKAGVNIDLITSKTEPLQKRLKELSKVAQDSDALNKIFGVDAGLAQGLFQNVDGFEKMLKSVNTANTATEQARKNTNTFKFALESIKTSFLNVTTATNTGNFALGALKLILVTVADNMGTLVAVAGTLLTAFVAWKAVVLATTIATWAQSVAAGANAAMHGTLTKKIVANKVALTAYKVVQGISTAATWVATAATTAFAAAMNLGLWPILLITGAIAGVIAVIMNWSSVTSWFGEKWTTFTQFISNAWAKMTGFFSAFDFKGFFMDIGRSVISFLLLPLKWVLTLLSKLPGKVGNLAQTGLDKLNEITGNVDVQNEVIPSTAQQAANTLSQTVTENNSNLKIEIEDKGNNVKKVESDNDIPVAVTNTQGAF